MTIQIPLVESVELVDLGQYGVVESRQVLVHSTKTCTFREHY